MAQMRARILLPIRLEVYCDHASLFVCLLVGWLVRSLARYTHCDFSKSTNPIFLKFGTDTPHLCRTSLLTFERPKSKFNVKTVLSFNCNSSFATGHTYTKSGIPIDTGLPFWQKL